MPQVDAATVLEDVVNIAQELYFPEFTEETPALHGKTTNKLFKPMMEEITGTGKNLQFEVRRADTFRPLANALADFENPDVFEEGIIKYRFNRQVPANSDFVRVSGSAQTNLIDVEEAGKGSIVDFVERTLGQIMPDWENKVAMLRHAPKTGLLALVNGTPRQNDSHFTGDPVGGTGATSATPTNATGARFSIDSGSIANFREGMYVDIFDPTNAVFSAKNVRIEGKVNTADAAATGPTFGVEFNLTGRNRVSSGNLADIADNDEIYLAGSKGEGMHSMGSFFGRPTAGESFIGGVDRTTLGFQWMLPLTTREGQSNTVIDKSHFNDIAIAMNFEEDEVRDGYVAIMPLDIHQTLRDAIGEDAFITYPTGDSRMARFANFGNIGLNYQHPVFGTMKMMADPLSIPDTVRFILPDTWKALFYGFRGLKSVPGDDIGGWYRMNADATGAGKGVILKRDYWSIMGDMCFKPWLNAQIDNVTA